MDTFFRIIKQKTSSNQAIKLIYSKKMKNGRRYESSGVYRQDSSILSSHHPSEQKDDSCHEMSVDHIVDQTLCVLKSYKGKQLAIHCTVHFSLVSYKVLKLIVKNQHLFVKLKSSCSVVVCLLKGTLFHLLWLLSLFHFLFLNLIFVEKKKAKINISIFIQHNFFHQKLMNCFPCCFR